MIIRKTFSRLPRESSGTLNFRNPIGCLVVKYTKWTFTSGAVRRYEYYDNTIKIACSRLFPTTGRQEDIKLYYIDFSSYVDVFARRQVPSRRRLWRHINRSSPDRVSGDVNGCSLHVSDDRQRWTSEELSRTGRRGQVDTICAI